VAAALGAIEVLQAQGRPALAVAREVLARAQEVAIDPDLERHGGGGRDPGQLGGDVVLAGLDHDHAGRSMARDRARQLAAQGLGVTGRVEVDVVDGEAAGAQGLGVMAHRREEQRDPRLVRPHLGGLAGGLDHHDDVAPRIDVIERGAGEVELVAQDQDEIARHRALDARAGVGLRRTRGATPTWLARPRPAPAPPRFRGPTVGPQLAQPWGMTLYDRLWEPLAVAGAALVLLASCW
jgi:hypothetical protein